MSELNVSVSLPMGSICAAFGVGTENSCYSNENWGIHLIAAMMPVRRHLNKECFSDLKHWMTGDKHCFSVT